MGEYGVTKNGFILKRFDTVYSSIADKVKDYAGIDIEKNPDSVLNLAIFFPVADLIARLHEECLDVYNSLHPSTAEGVALDDACQYANVRRKAAKKTVYQISCNMTDGNTLLADTIIAADTNPRHDLYCDTDTVISRDAWNEAYIKLVTSAVGTTYKITVDDDSFTYISESGDQETILTGIAELIQIAGVTASVNENNLVLKCTEPDATHKLELSETLTTESITGLVKFSTGEYGSIIMPDNTITKIISNKSTGFNWCDNRIAPVAGRLAEEDYELRQDYIAQINSHFSNMVGSIRSYLLANVENIKTVNVYENTGDTVDAEGRLPHSIEVIADGGTDEDVAYGILACRPGGIQTNGDVSVDCEGENGESINIRFNRPGTIFAWLYVKLSGDESAVPSNYKRIVTDMLLDAYGDLTSGQTLYNQTLISDIYKKIPGLTRVSVLQYHTTDATVPEDSQYEDSNISAKRREKIIVAENRIKVVLSSD